MARQIQAGSSGILDSQERLFPVTQPPLAQAPPSTRARFPGPA